MTEIKEAIEILEKVLKPLDACEPQCKLNLNPEKIRKALVLLRKAPEQPPAGKFRERVKNLVPVFLPDNHEGLKLLCATLTDTVKEACDIIDRSEAEKTAWEKQKCGKGFFYREGLTCDDRHANIGHYVTHYKRAKQIIEKQTQQIGQFESSRKELLEACEEYSKGVMLLRESDNEIILGAAFQLQKADGLGITAIERAKIEI